MTRKLLLALLFAGFVSMPVSSAYANPEDEPSKDRADDLIVIVDRDLA